MANIVKKGKYSEFDNGESGLTKLVEYNGKKYVLRKFKTKRKSDQVYEIYKKLEKFGILPKLYYRRGNNFIFEFIPGRECKKPPENLDVIKQVAKICAIVNKLKVNSVSDVDGSFRKALNVILKGKKISPKQLVVLKKVYFTKKEEIRPSLVLEVWDVHSGNFILYKKKVYLVDVGGIRVDYKGLGIIKSLSWFKTGKQRSTFRKSYDSVASIKYMDEDYTNFLIFYYYINSLSERILKNKEWEKSSKERLTKALAYAYS